MRSLAQVIVGIVALVAGIAALPVHGQVPGGAPDSAKPWHDGAWTPILTRGGMRIDYIYYPEADNEHGGVVLRLTNEGGEPVAYSFTLVLRAPDAETTAVVEGRLAPGEMRTGEPAGLFWVPFKKQDRSLAEIGLRGVEVWPVRDPDAERPESL